MRLGRVEVSYGSCVASVLVKTCLKLKKRVNVRHCGSFVLSSWPFRLSFQGVRSLNHKHVRRLRRKTGNSLERSVAVTIFSVNKEDIT